MYFRFTAGLLLAMAVSIAGTWLEKLTRGLQREVSLQHYQADVLRELIVRRRLDVARLTGQRSSVDRISGVGSAGGGTVMGGVPSAEHGQ
ncbi:MAG: hypothetical protein ACKO2L_02925 [Planctomycetaceae bacterium]